MTQTSYPLPPSRQITDAEYERLMGDLMPSGWLAEPTEPPIVYADGTALAVTVRAGKRVWVRGFLWESGDTDFTLSIDSNDSGSTRVDLVVVRLDRATWECTIEVRKGTPGAGPPSPVMQFDTGVYEVPVATVTVATGATVIAAAAVLSVAWAIGTGGLIQCLSSWRPPHAANRLIWERDTGRQVLSTGTAWRAVFDDTGWLSCTLRSGWSTSPTGYCRVRRYCGVAYLYIDLFRSGNRMAAGGASTTIATLPAGFAPPHTVIVPAAISYTAGRARININSAGEIRVNLYDVIDKGHAVSAAASWPLG